MTEPATDLARSLADARAHRAAIDEILRLIGRAPGDAQAVFDKIVECCDRLFVTNHVALWLLGEDGHLHLNAYRSEFLDANPQLPRAFAADDAVIGSALRECRALHYANSQRAGLALSAETQAWAQALGEHTLLMAPFVQHGRGIGMVFLVRRPPRAFSDDEIALLVTFCDQAVIAIENARLFRETQEALERQTALADILRVISESPTDVQPVFDAIAERAARLCAADMGLSFRYDGESLHLASVYGVSADGEAAVRGLFPQRPDPTSFLGRVALEGLPVHAADATIELESGFQDSVRRIGARSVLGVPMMRDGRVIGGLGVARHVTGGFAKPLVQVLEGFAAQAVIALENTRLFRETQEALEQQTATAEVLQVIGSSVENAQPVFEKILDSCQRLIECSDVSVMTVDRDAMVSVGSARGEGGARYAAMRPTPVRNTVIAQALEQRRIMHYPDVRYGEGVPEVLRRVAAKIGNFSVIIAPMLWRGRGVGGLNVVRRHAHREWSAFTPRDMSLLATFADQAVIAIQNATLFSETREALEQQTATAEVLRVISSSVADTGPVFEKILESCLRLFNVQDVGIFLLDAERRLDLAAGRGPFMPKVADVFPLALAGTIQESALSGADPLHYSSAALAAPLPVDIAFVREVIGDHSAVVAPMIWEGRGIGNIVIAAFPARTFSEKEIALLGTFAGQAVIAIQNVHLFREIRAKSEQLEIANQHKSEFLANMSHELRTPLNAVIGFSEVLVERLFGDLNDKQEEYLRDILSSGKHLLSLINDILDLSKIEAGHVMLEPSTFDVASAIDNAVTLVRERASRHGLHVEIDVGSEVGEWRADERKFRQILLNLLSNAVKFTPDGGRIRVTARQPDEETLEVTVSDTGIGIAPEDQVAVFEEFRQVGRHYTNKQEGTGLGLALSRRFVELHGGTLRVASALGAGSTFTFSLRRLSE